MYADSYREGTLLNIWIQPKAAKTKIVGIYGDSIKIAVKSPPVDGKANDECIRFLGKLLGVKREHVSIKSGLQNRHKTIYIKGATPEVITGKMEYLLRDIP
jgi:uncharacterized protein